MTTELVLPSGAFASYGDVTILDWVRTMRECRSGEKEPVYALFALVGKIDGEMITYDDLMKRDIRDGLAIGKWMGALIEAPVSSGV